MLEQLLEDGKIEGKREDLVEVWEDGWIDGWSKGYDHGVKSGKSQAIQVAVKALLADNVEWQIITKATGITPETFKEDVFDDESRELLNVFLRNQK